MHMKLAVRCSAQSWGEGVGTELWRLENLFRLIASTAYCFPHAAARQ